MENIIKVEDIVESKQFDSNCIINVYDGTKGTWHETEPVWSTLSLTAGKLPKDIAKRKISYMTIDVNIPALVIEFE